MYVAHFYDLDLEDIGAIHKQAVVLGLEVTMHGKSWYFPGMAIQVEWRARRRTGQS